MAVSKCLNLLKYRSLLSIDGNKGRYRFHQLVKEFLTSQGLTMEQEQFSDHFAIYYVTLYCGVALPDIEAKHHLEAFQILDLHGKIQLWAPIYYACFYWYSKVMQRIRFWHSFSCEHLWSSGKTTNRFHKASHWGWNKVVVLNYCQLLNTILMLYDVHFTPISNHIGNSASFEVYVNSTANVTFKKKKLRIISLC